MRRRVFVAAAAAWATIGWTAGATAQSKGAPIVIGWLHFDSHKAGAPSLAAFKDALAALGLKDGAQISIEARWVEGRIDRLPALADELAAKKPAVVVTTSGQVTSIMTKAAPNTPIVQASGTNPVEIGLAAGLARPGGMVTGMTNLNTDLSEKLVELLLAVDPKVKRIGFLLHVNIRGKTMSSQVEAARRAAAAYSVEAHFAQPAKADDIERAISTLARQGVQALIAMPSPLLNVERLRIIGLATAQRWPLAGIVPAWAEQGALLSYGIDSLPNYRRAAYYVDRILKGAKAGDLPIEQPTKFVMVVNLKTAKALGITIPQSVLLQASRVIE